MSIVDVVKQKMEVAEALDRGECGGGYTEACILISAVLSGIAADLWPGKRLDKKRFVELWARYSDPTLSPCRISVPLLVRWLRKEDRTEEAKLLEDARPQVFGRGFATRVVTGADVDMTQAEVSKICSSLSVAEIRKHSYPAIFYEHVRSALVHEYHLGDTASGWPMTEQHTWVSYVNLMDPASRWGSQRQIYYHMGSLTDLVRSIAQNVVPVINSRPLPEPAKWWLCGG